MKKLLIYSLVFFSLNLKAQEHWLFKSQVSFDRYEIFKGTINGKYPITMYREESYESCSKYASRWTPRLVYGWYKYNNVGTKIPIVGSICYADACESYLKLFVPEDFTKYSIDENCDMLNFREVFSQEQGQELMQWQMAGKDKYPVQLTPVHEFSWRTRVDLNLEINEIEIEKFNLSELSKNEYIENVEILSQKFIGDKFYMIIQYSHQSNPGSFGHGMCGAGLEQYIGHLKIDKNFRVQSFEEIQTSSCINSFDNVNVIYDVNKPELGIRKN